MAALSLLLGAALLLLALGALWRAMPGLAPGAMSLLCVVGLGAAVAAPAVATLAGPVAFGVDGLSAAVLSAMFLWAAAARRSPIMIGALALAVLAADGASFAVACAVALAASGAFARAQARQAGRVVALAGLGALVVGLVLLGGLDLRFAAMRDGVEGLRGAAVLVAAVAAAGLFARALGGLPGGLVALYVVGRLLLDLAGPVTPGWWGVAVVVLGLGLALDAVRRIGALADAPGVGERAAEAALGVAIAALGAALLARGADVPPLAALAVTAALLQALCTAGWAGLLAMTVEACAEAVGGPELPRMGGLLRRMPATGLAMLVGLLSMACLPGTAGFAGFWASVQALLGAGRTGGIVIVMLAAGGIAGLGLAMAVLTASAVRLGGVVLLGAARTAKAAGAAEPPLRLRVGMGVMAVAVLVLGVCPGLGVMVVAPASRLLAGGAADGAGLLVVAPGLDMPGYAAPVVVALLAVVMAGVGWWARGVPGQAAAWQGGFIEDGVGRGNVWPQRWPAMWPAGVAWGWVALAVLALALAAALGWAAR